VGFVSGPDYGPANWLPPSEAAAHTARWSYPEPPDLDLSVVRVWTRSSMASSVTSSGLVSRWSWVSSKPPCRAASVASARSSGSVPGPGRRATTYEIDSSHVPMLSHPGRGPRRNPHRRHLSLSCKRGTPSMRRQRKLGHWRREPLPQRHAEHDQHR